MGSFWYRKVTLNHPKQVSGWYRDGAMSMENKTEQKCIIETQHHSHFVQREESCKYNLGEAGKLWVSEPIR